MSEKITAETRTEFGKGAARRIRREDKVPAVVYGHGNDPIHLTLPGHDTMMALKHGGANALLELDIEGKTQLALTKQVQVDPITPRTSSTSTSSPSSKGEKVTVEIPVHLDRRGRPRDAGRHRERHRPGRGRGHPHPRVHRGRHRGRRGRHPDPRLRPQAARRARPCCSTRRR